MGLIPDAVCERAATKYTPNEGGCWISDYSVGSDGYAQIGWWNAGKSSMTTAHRAAWTFHHGQAPAELVVDHVCHVRRCVNPAHLRLLSRVTNSRDNLSERRATNLPAGKKCTRGHEMVTGTTQNYCRECKRLAALARKKRSKS